MHDSVTRRVDGEFAELICADDQWLREEFDALIAASYGRPPARPGPPAPPHNPPGWRPRRYSPAARRPHTPTGTWTAASSGTIRRQRSPPVPA
jgi:hypothetical protein